MSQPQIFEITPNNSCVHDPLCNPIAPYVTDDLAIAIASSNSGACVYPPNIDEEISEVEKNSLEIEKYRAQRISKIANVFNRLSNGLICTSTHYINEIGRLNGLGNLSSEEIKWVINNYFEC